MSPGQADNTRPPRRILYSLRALGREDLPEQVEAGGRIYRRQQTIKHDFFAATGLYADAGGQRAVLKMGRTVRFWGIPMR